ncbi:galactokinase [Paenactinomyces guangxiensis]|uniref:Galactokinase n=1 Tax=Paenactinomyces guangxiensis TaxID=1490290 RepID=A0A7W1WQJ4_9BACL|nr:galactokinase [Paenactinomyces guangxiensis]MBA4494205.1 galactokinase [Paenactinomyces guangxiensis]MBH8590701.1 galactokinase [Paenactinomyces guangxiensis]
MKNLTRQLFEKIFGKGAWETRLFFAPGRVNLIGEHTDYTGGWVFPAALSFGTWARVRVRNDRLFRFASTSFAGRFECHADDITYHDEDSWANYPKGVLKGFINKGVPLQGLDILYDGNIPTGAGLSSSASIELVTAVALNLIYQTGFSMIELVQIAQQAENQFVGVNCGIMDQFAVGMGKEKHAILLNCQNLQYSYTNLDLREYKLVITNTNKPRNLAESKYNERRAEVEEGFRMMSPYLAGPECLGQVTLKEWEQVRHAITDPTIAKRVEHVVKENDRVRQSSKALRAGDLSRFGQLMNQSHQSLRDLYEVTGHELDTLADLARQTEGCIGSRMTGAGFGGCTVSLVHQDVLNLFRQQVQVGYSRETGLAPAFYVAEIGAGARELSEGDAGWRSW